MKNETKHTSGMWQVKRLNEDYGYGYWKTDIFVDIGENELIKIGTHDDPKNAYYKDVARLIACAPELLEIANRLLFLATADATTRALNPHITIDVDELRDVVYRSQGIEVATQKIDESITSATVEKDGEKNLTTELLEALEIIENRLSNIPIASRSPEERLDELLDWIDKDILPLCKQLIAKAKGGEQC